MGIRKEVYINFANFYKNFNKNLHKRITFKAIIARLLNLKIGV